MHLAAVIDDALPANPVSSTSRLRGQKKDVQALSVEDLNAVRSAVDSWMTKKRPGPKPNQDMPDIIDLNRPGFRGGSVTWNQPRLGRVFQRSR